jgi:plasmid stabilization system protein ParE
MSFVVRKIPHADEDMLEAARWYDRRELGLGDQFLDEVDAAVASLGDRALLYAVRFADARRAPVRRFRKYGVFYVIRGEEVVVFAVVHGSRSPRWARLRRRLLG